MDTNQDRKIDNEVLNRIDSHKKMIDSIDNEIIKKKKSLNSYDELEKIYVESNKSINEAAILINKSYGPGGNKKMNAIVDESNSKLPKLLFELDEKRIVVKKEMNGLYDKKDECLRNLKKEYESLEEKEDSKEEKEVKDVNNQFE